MSVPEITARELVERYDAVLLDSYGVLVDSEGALEHAAAFIDFLRERRKPHLVLTNDASRLLETAQARYRGLGLAIDADRILTSGRLLERYFELEGLQGAHCAVLGPEDSRVQVTRAGGRVFAPEHEAHVLVVCDDEGYPFLPTLERVLGWLYARIDRGAPVRLVLPNPDLVYPKGLGRVGLTAGAVAHTIEAALRVRFGDRAPSFERLGKPHAPMFDRARQVLGLPEHAKIAMLGDQLATDVAGALDAEMDAVLVGTGLTNVDAIPDGPRPTWILRDLSLTR